ncbi:MAG: helix-turn-helix domain-containing protein [Firmicutes bacterium]|nr:helix-turn-helix domain-containing protein [Bacillota bacterium]
MHSYEDRMKAVMLYIKYDFSAADAIRELGYPGRKTLVRWYREYEATGELHRRYRRGYRRAPRHTPEQMQDAVDYYLDHRRNISRAVRTMGYPSKETPVKWIDQLALARRKINMRRSSGAFL